MVISLDKIRTHVIQTSENGVVNKDTVFNFAQVNNEVSGTYSGGLICEDKLSFAYYQLHTDGTMGNGVSTCEISKSQNGKLKLVEHFQWSSRPGEGGNAVTVITDP